MADDREQGTTLDPKYDAAGLVTAVVTRHGSPDVLMVAHMNAEALERTLATGYAHFWSRSRKALWKKGETSGHVPAAVVETPRRLRSGRDLDQRRSRRPRVPHWRAELLLSPHHRRGLARDY